MFQRKIPRYVRVEGNNTNQMIYDAKKLRRKTPLSYYVKIQMPFFGMKNVKITELIFVACAVIATMICLFFYITRIRPGDMSLFVEFAAEESGTSGAKIAVFYHVLTKNMIEIPRVRSIVDEQLSNLRPHKYKVFVRYISQYFNIENVSHFQYDKEDTEIGTLKLLWEYCQVNPTDKVVYIHSLGSWESDKTIRRLRRFATKGALSKECANLPDSCNVCASRMSPVPHPHAPGNMWLARCDYIKTLNDPKHFVDQMNKVEFSYKGNKHDAPLEYDGCKGLGDYAAEHWVYSHPKVKPCDLLSDNNKYVWDIYDIPDTHFKAHLKPAPRFDLKTYNIGQHQCEDWGLIVEDRLMEYHTLYGEGAPKSWWGWKLFNTTYTSGITKNPLECKCVDCEEDKECGDLWDGNQYAVEKYKSNNKKMNKKYKSNNNNKNKNKKGIFDDDSDSSDHYDKKYSSINKKKDKKYKINSDDSDSSDPYDDILHSKRIHFVVSHCKSDLDWMSNFTDGYNITSIHIISKCGEPVKGAPIESTIQILPNIGRCDHTYAFYINNILHHEIGPNDNPKDSIVFFLKDDIVSNHQPGFHHSFEDMLHIVSSPNGFSCGVVPHGWPYFLGDNFISKLSAYHVTNELFLFNMYDYKNPAKHYGKDDGKFKSKYDNFGSFYKSVIAKPTPDLVPVCYGGFFAASVYNIWRVDSSIWNSFELILSRGNSIEEGHFVERSWAMLLSDPIEPYKVEALLEYSDLSIPYWDFFPLGEFTPGQLIKRKIKRHKIDEK